LSYYAQPRQEIISQKELVYTSIYRGKKIRKCSKSNKQKRSYQWRRQGLQIDDREGEAEKRQNGVRVEQEDEIKEGVK
jgi:hypothetical protein